MSFVSTENAKANLQKELGEKSFESVKSEASATWEKLPSKTHVSGGTERQKELFYPFLRADPSYIVSVPFFEKMTFHLNEGKMLTILKKNSGSRITSITYGGKKVEGYFVNHNDLETGRKLVTATE